MSTCSGNSTDCLLGQLVDEGQGFNWDPLNFAFTAILSILALFIAFLALLQGLLAAGPGRLKASQNVLGPIYSRTARTRFDWTEWRFRTSVQVPIIDVAQIISASPLSEHNEHSNEQEQSRWNQVKPTPNPLRRSFARIYGFKYHGPDIEAPFAESGEVSASWAMLLRHVGLEAVKLRTKYCKTDHLPGDVAAAPAFATIESLIILAVLAGCTSYFVRQDLPLAKGPQVQMVLRAASKPWPCGHVPKL